MPFAVRTQCLASCYENALTIILRLWSIQQQSPVNSQDFRTSIRAALKAAMEQAKALGYSGEMNQLAFFAAVAFLDESVLKMQNPAFADWAQRPLQEEMFGHNRAGEVFFEHLHALLVRQDSAETADCLEIFCLCMLLGFKGKYALNASIGSFSGQPESIGSAVARPSGDIQNLIRQARAKMDRIRGRLIFMPDNAPPELKKTASSDPWSRRLGIAAIIMLVLVVLAFGGFLIILRSAVSQIA